MKTRKPLGYSPINPKITSIFIDSCAFGPKYSPEDQASKYLFELFEKGELNLIIAHSNQKEVEHPNTPSWVKREANKLVFTIEISLTLDEQTRKANILNILTGNGNPDKMLKDSEHVFEADKYGSYFVTTDERILKKQKELSAVVSVNILKPSDLIEVIKSYKNS